MKCSTGKRCSCCKQIFPYGNFYKSSIRKDGFHVYCIDCEKEKSHEQFSKHREKRIAKQKEWYKNNKSSRAISQARWGRLNKRKILDAGARYAKRHPDKVLAKVIKREAKKLRAIPKWANGFFVDEIYNLASLRTKSTGIKWHVDHVVPLQNDLVCGLHCESNLQVIPAHENHVKSNVYWPDMP